MTTGIYKNYLMFGGNKQEKDERFSLTAKGQKKGGKFKVKKSINASSYMIQIANAKTSSQASAIIRQARADASFVKGSSSSEADKKKALRILEGVVEGATMKMQRLKKEQQMESHKKLLEALKKAEAASEVGDKLKKKKRARKAQEAARTCDEESVDIQKEMSMGEAVTSASCAAPTAAAVNPGTVVDVSL